MPNRQPPQPPTHDPADLPGKIRRLRERRRDIMALPPQEALGRILSDPEPVPLIHSIPEEDFLCLVHDIGPEDALPLLARASNRQLEFLNDQEAWAGDRFDVAAATRWWDLLFRADPERFARWAVAEQKDALRLYLFRTLEVRIREHDQDPSEFGEGFLTLDGTFFFRFTGIPAPGDLPPGSDDRRLVSLVGGLLKTLADADFSQYQELIIDSGGVLPAETEEELFRLRNVRLAERGFLPFDEAVGLYQPLDASAFGLGGRRRPTSPTRSAPPLPSPPGPGAESGGPFSEALMRLEDAGDREELQQAFAALCNQLIVADRIRVRGREDLTPVVRKAHGFLSIGLAALHRRNPRLHPSAVLRHHLLPDLFRVGYGQVARVKREADRWVPGSWFVRQGFPITFWEETWGGMLGGLLLKRPRYFNRYRDGLVYREFERLEEVAEAGEILGSIQAVDRLLSALGAERAPGRGGAMLSWRNVLLTLWARAELGMDPEIAPVPVDRFRPFFRRLFPDSPLPESARGPDPAMKDRMFHWLARTSEIDPVSLSRSAGKSLEALFEALESEYGRVPEERLDPRFSSLFRLSP